MFSSDSWLSSPASSFYPHSISQSLRFEDGDSPKLSKTYSSAGNRRLFTLSGWFKRGELGATNTFYGAGSNGSNYFKAGFFNNDKLYIEVASGGANPLLLVTTQLFRDVSAWYHIQYVIDTAQSTDTNRIKIYVNGSQITSFSTATYFSQNYDFEFWTTAIEHQIGQATAASVAGYDGYIAELCYLDGTAALPASFGELKDSIWVAKDVSGLTFGNNGFHLDFADDSSIGNDVSGQNNDFAVSGLAATDVVPDSPTNNFATMNPIHKGNGTTGSITYSEGNLASSFAGNHTTMQHAATMALPTEGKWYWEQTFTGALTNGSRAAICGIWNDDAQDLGSNNRLTVTSDAVTFYSDDNKIYSSADGSIGNVSYTSSIAEQTGAVVSFAVDMDNTWVWVAVNGTYINGTPDFSDGTNRVDVVTDTNGRYIPFWAGDGGGTITWRVNFGQDSANVSSANSDSKGIGTFEYAVPSGYTSLCSANLPEPAIIDGSEYFNTVVYSGNGGTQDITVGFATNWVWNKRRDGAANHVIYDSVRGTGKELSSSHASAEASGVAGVTSFLSDGYSLGNNGNINDSGETYASWNWLAGTAASGSESGNNPAFSSSSNATAGFSIVSYTGTGAVGTVSHGCGAVPTMIMIKNRDVGDQWAVYHQAIGATHNLCLNNTDAKADQDNRFNDTEPTSSVFTIGTGHVVNADGEKYIAYCFTDIEGYCKAGVYSGNGSTDGVFVFTGFRPAWIMFKLSSNTGSWRIMDNKRDTFNVANARLLADTNGAETTDRDILDMVSNGFKFRRGDGGNNASGSTYIFLAFSEQPTKYSNAK